MFEDATFESTGRIPTRSGRWMVATLLLNSSVLVVLILVPLFYPEALPHEALSILLTAPPPPPQAMPQQPEKKVQTFHGAPQMDAETLIAPRRIPEGIARFQGTEETPGGGTFGIEGLPGALPSAGDVFRGQRSVQVAPAKQGPVRVSSLVEAGLLVHKILPVYPPIAVAARMEGAVVLQATISKSGTIENLRVVSGPAMLQQAAMDAVKQWRYRPFLLNGEPVEVETTVNVIFAMSH